MSKAKTAEAGKTSKTAESSQAKTETNNSKQQLAAIRDLLFGEQVKVLEQSLKEQNNALNQRLNSLEAQMAKNSAEFSSQLTKASQTISDALEANRLEHVSQEGILEEKLEQLNGHLNDFQQATEKEFSQSHAALAQTADELNQSISKEVKQLTNQIEHASKELGSNKADRKTLASLLESMASNLNESQA